MLIELGRRLRAARKQNTEMSIEEVARAIGTTFSSVAKYERGETMPPLDKLNAMADLYNVSVDDLLGRPQKSVIMATRGMPLPPIGAENLTKEELEEIEKRTREFHEFEVRRRLREKGIDA